MKKAAKFFGITSIILLGIMIVGATEDLWGKFVPLHLPDGILLLTLTICGILLTISVLLVLILGIFYRISNKNNIS